MRDSKTLRVYKIRDFKIFRGSMILLVYKTTVRVCNFYVDATQASCEIGDSKILSVYKIRDSKISRAYKIAVRGCNSGQVRNT